MLDPQLAAQAAIDRLTERGPELAMQVAAYRNGALIINAASGWVDPARTKLATPETLFTVYSAAKGVTATAIHLLCERLQLDYDEPIATYWPAFAVNGKGKITTRQVLLHTAGLQNLPANTETDDYTDWQGMLTRIEAMSPASPPGAMRVYHAMTQGWILGGLVERVTRRTFAEFIRTEMQVALGLEAVAMGASPRELPLVAELVDAPALLAAPQVVPETAPGDSLNANVMNRDSMRQACLPAYGLLTNARSLAGIYASLISKGLAGRRLVGDRQVRLATVEASTAPMYPGGPPVRTGLGYNLGGRSPILGPVTTTFGHVGRGGSVGLADPHSGLALAVVKNYLCDDATADRTCSMVLNTLRALCSEPPPR